MAALSMAAFFAGIGGFDLGFEREGFNVAAQVEVDANCRKLLAAKFPEAAPIRDIMQIASVFKRLRQGKSFVNYERWQLDFERLRTAAVWCGGFPCQDLSVAGQRAGLAGGRSGLWFAFRRVIALFRPPLVVIENVPGLLSSHGGADLAVIVQGLAKLGYRWAYRVLDAQYFGLAQRRARVFIVASLGDWRCAEILFERESVPWDSAPGRETGKSIAPTLEARAGRSGLGDFATSGGLVAGTLNARTRGGGGLGTDFECAGGVVAGTVPETAKCLNAGRDGYNDGSDQTYVCAVSSKWAKGTGGPSGDECQNLIAQVPAVNQGSGGNRAWLSGDDPHQTLTKEGQPNAIALMANGVRRLTPVECERLQGFPDGWTEGFSDSVRYRMLGNAVAVPVAQWLARRIREVIG